MRRRTDRVLYIMLILMGLITVLAMMFAGVLGIMYVKEKDKNQEAAVKQAQLEEEVVAAFAGDNNAFNDEEVQQLVDAKEVEMKAKMKELVQSEDGGAMTMLRYFFPENLVYYDEGGYVFAPILDTLKKHQLVDENFHINDRNEIEYIENDEEDDEDDPEMGDFSRYNFSDFTNEFVSLVNTTNLNEKITRFILDHKEDFYDTDIPKEIDGNGDEIDERISD